METPTITSLDSVASQLHRQPVLSNFRPLPCTAQEMQGGEETEIDAESGESMSTMSSGPSEIYGVCRSSKKDFCLVGSKRMPASGTEDNDVWKGRREGDRRGERGE